jgi:hypothetical protein
MKQSSEPVANTQKPVSGSCATRGSCGVRGMCPGQALLVSLVVGMALTSLTGLAWLTPVVGILLGAVLITGVWRRLLPKRFQP